MFVCVCMYVCMCICMYVYVCMCVYVCVIEIDGELVRLIYQYTIMIDGK